MRRLCTRLLFLLLTGGLIRGASAQPETRPLPGPEQAVPIRFNHLMPEDGLSQQVVPAILQDRNGFMWFDTYNGLNRYDGYDVQVYHHDPDDSTSLRTFISRSLVEDQAGMIWVGTAYGLNRLDPETGVPGSSPGQAITRYLSDPEDPGSLSNRRIFGLYERPQEPGILWVGVERGG